MSGPDEPRPRTPASIGRAAGAGLVLAASLAATPARAQDPSVGAGAPGLAIEASWTQFLQSAVGGEGDDELRTGGKLRAQVGVPGDMLWLWPGFTINVGAEYVFGRSANQAGTGMLLPPNVAMSLPANGDERADLSLNFTQQIGASSLTFGKINMLNQAARTPLVGGGGLDGFLHTALATPPSLIAPPTILGALWSGRVAPAAVTVGVWDPTSALNRSGLDSPFEAGVAGMVAVALPVVTRVGPAFHSLTVFGSSKRGLDLNDVPNLLLPPESETVLREKRGAWYVKYALQQPLWRNAADATRAGGVFGHVGLWDGNPSAMRWNMTVGTAGAVPLAARPFDTFGVGYFRTSLSRTLRRGLEPVLELGDEQGVEAFYTFHVYDFMRVTADAQWVDPAVRSATDAVVLGLRLGVGF